MVEALLYLQAGMPERADELAELALITEPEPQVWLASGLAKLALGQYAEAAERLANVPPGTRGFAEARVALATALRARGLPALAADVLVSSLGGGGGDDELLLREALADARLEAGEVEGVLEALTPVEGHRGRVARARVLERSGRWEEAARVWAAIPADLAELNPRSRARFKLDGQATQPVRGGRRKATRAHLAERVTCMAEDASGRGRRLSLGKA